MNTELLEALNILEKEKDISKETLLDAIENSLMNACKNHFGKTDNIKLIMNKETCEIISTVGFLLIFNITFRLKYHFYSIKPQEAVKRKPPAADFLNLICSLRSFRNQLSEMLHLQVRRRYQPERITLLHFQRLQIRRTGYG